MVDIKTSYEEIKSGRIEPMMPKLTFTRSETQDDDIICFQVDMNDEYVIVILGTELKLTFYYDFLDRCVMNFFKTRFEETDAEHLNLSKKQNCDAPQYDGERLNWDPVKLHNTTTHPNGTPSLQTTAILHEKLNVSTVEHETERSFTVIKTGIHNKEESTVDTPLLPVEDEPGA
ncbi:hypothetical protein FKP32DRAFT_1678289 [Trametes sanguinea]|nr:hypothetical protein FKP32DRAFT_1678289 [Trametes sanguinea]